MPPKASRNRGPSSSSSSGTRGISRLAPIDPRAIAERAEFDFGDNDGGRKDRYENFIDQIITLCSDNRRKRVLNVPVCQTSERNPLILVSLKAYFAGRQCNRSFLMFKGTLYIKCFTVGQNEWKKCSDFLNHVENCGKAGFSSSYMDMGPDPTKLGPGAILSAMSMLDRNENDSSVWPNQLKIICYHIAEASRFTEIKKTIADQMNEWSQDSTIDLLPHLKVMVKNWETISEALTSYESYLKENAEKGLDLTDKEKEDQWETILGKNVVNKTGLETGEDAMAAMGILLK